MEGVLLMMLLWVFKSVIFFFYFIGFDRYIISLDIFMIGGN